MSPRDHVRESVARHRWTDLDDWLSALSELAEMAESEIEAIAAEVQQQDRKAA